MSPQPQPQPQPPYPILLLRDDHNSNSTTSANSTISPTPTPQPKEHQGGGFPGFLIAVIIIGVLAGLGFAALIFYRRYASKRRAFGSAPGPSLDGAKASLSSLWYKIKNPRDRSASAGFEGISAGRAQHRGRALDPDSAWDTSVGTEADAYYEDTELQSGTSGYHGVGGTEYHGAAGASGRGTRGMPAENPFGDEHTTAKPSLNPFGDEHADHMNIRSVSPRPVVDTGVAGHGGPAQTSPTRRSLFKEEM